MTVYQHISPSLASYVSLHSNRRAKHVAIFSKLQQVLLNNFLDFFKDCLGLILQEKIFSFES